jgi:molecular chaperone HscB
MSKNSSEQNLFKKTSAKADYFSLLKVKRSFDIDFDEVKKNFTNLQRVLHPDKFATASKEAQEQSLELSSRVNQAFKTLQDPHKRGLYLLSLKGVEVKEDESDLGIRGDFLEEVMEMNERVAEAKEGESDKLNQLRREVNQTLQHLKSDISAAFREDTNDSASLEKCKQLLIRYKFYQTLSQNLREKED